jgi:hypothetical protein
MAVCVGAAVLLVATGAVAAGALKDSSAEFTIPPHDFGDGIAACEAGARAVAGGFEVTEPGLFPSDSARESKGAWRSGGTSNDDQPETATVYAYCDRRARKLKEKSGSQAIDAMSVETITARCGRGKEAVSGGFDSPDDSLGHVNLVGSHRAGKRKWALTLFNASVQSETFTAFAYCDKTQPRLKTRSESVTVDSAFGQSVAASCAGKQRLRAGGFEVEYSEAADQRGRITLSRRIDDRGWEAGARFIEGTPDLTAYAYCKKKRNRK